LVRAAGFSTPRELSIALRVSEMTIRRDLALLSTERRLQQVHGGASALPAHAHFGTAFQARAESCMEQKRAIGRTAVQLISEDSTIAVDSGTTLLEFVRAIPETRRVHLVTASLPAIAHFASHGREVTSLGGLFHPELAAFAGPLTLDAIRQLRVNTLFLGASAVRREGVLCANQFDAMTKRGLLEIADEVVLLADSSKFTAGARMVKVAELRELDSIVVDDALDQLSKRHLVDSNVCVLIADDRDD
jgi:DeoR/GlpR family transcriptional regulator of sugar metabolism